jgi:hypothetical protein
MPHRWHLSAYRRVPDFLHPYHALTAQHYLLRPGVQPHRNLFMATGKKPARTGKTASKCSACKPQGRLGHLAREVVRLWYSGASFRSEPDTGKSYAIGLCNLAPAGLPAGPPDRFSTLLNSRPMLQNNHDRIPAPVWPSVAHMRAATG